MKVCKENGIAVDTTRDAAVFTVENLKQYKVVVFLNTTGDVLDNAQQEAFIKYIQSGGGFVGVHAATDTEYDWPWYNKLVGAYFLSHPAQQQEALLRWWTKQILPRPCYLRNGNGRMNGIISRISVRIFMFWHTWMKHHIQAEKMAPKHPFIWYHEFDGGTGILYRRWPP